MLPSSSLVTPIDFPESGRGLGCVRDVEEGEELVAVPLHACWHAAASRASPDIQPLIAGGATLTDLDVCALHLLVERAKGDRSTQWEHIRQLPLAYDSTLFWEPRELAFLEGSDWHALALRFNEEARADWEAMRDALAGGNDTSDFLASHSIDWEGYLWAYATLKSRQVEAQVDSSPTRLMAPGFDLFNHSDSLTPGSSHFFDNDRRVLVCRATHAHRQGEQAFISYGTASNGSLLLGGGFVLDSNRFDFVEVLITSECDEQRLPIYLMAAPDVPPSSELAQFEFVNIPTDDQVTDGNTTPFTTRHRLTLEVPLPPSLLTRVRLDRMCEEELQHQQRRATKAGSTLWEAARGEAPLDPLHELVSLGALRSVLQAKLLAYPSSLEEDDAALAQMISTRDAPAQGSLITPQAVAVAFPRRQMLATILCASEKRILHAALSVCDTRIPPFLCELLRAAVAQEKACRASGKQWGTVLRQRETILKQQSARVHWFFERVLASSLGCESLTSALHAQTCTAFLMILSGLGGHSNASLSVYVPAASPFTLPALSEAGLRLQPPSVSLFSDSSGSELAYLTLYKSKMAMWGAYLLSQWGAAKALSVDECSTMQQEAVSIRLEHAWSVPTTGALDEMCRHSPLLELGAGTGHWAGLLRERGADIKAFDTRCWQPHFASSTLEEAVDREEGGDLVKERADFVSEGGPEQVTDHPGRTLVLMWPDYAGCGTYGLSCLEKYSGDRLILVGEWRGATFGAYTTRLSETGQSFSSEFQQRVESEFELESSQRLPNWPLFLDVLMVWRRRMTGAMTRS